jgi:Ca2+-binding RTX toxin-like protein
MRLCNFTNEEIFRSNFNLISLMTAASVTILLSFGQTGWADFITCDPNILECNGTPGDDIIVANAGSGNLIHGFEGNDYIESDVTSVIFGDGGNDILIGSNNNDVLNGGIGNDAYDGKSGSDTILEPDVRVVGPYVLGSDFISSGAGDDYISSGYGFDRINGGPDDDRIIPSGNVRDFNVDRVDCGAGAGDQVVIYSYDGDITFNCETVTDFDQ